MVSQSIGCISPERKRKNERRRSEFKRGDCTCPDFELRRDFCKHILAVQLVVKREQNADGSTTVTETITVSKRKTYKQKWPEYNAAQTTEKDHFQKLLADLCGTITVPP